MDIWSPVGGPGDNVAFRWENLAGGSASLGSASSKRLVHNVYIDDNCVDIDSTYKTIAFSVVTL